MGRRSTASVLPYASVATAVCCLLAASWRVAAGAEEPAADVSDELARRLYEWREDLPNVEVIVPAEVYRRFLLARDAPPPAERAPVSHVISDADYHVAIDGDLLDLTLTVRADILDTTARDPIPLLPRGPAWDRIEVNGAPARLREGERWLYLDDAGALRPADEEGTPFRIVAAAHAPVRGGTAAGVCSVELPRVPATLTTLKVDSDQAWEVASSHALLSLVGTERDGTHGTLGLTAKKTASTGGRQGGAQASPTSSATEPAPLPISLTWRLPRPDLDRPGRPLYDCDLAWHLTEGLQEVRAQLDVRITGGVLESLQLRLPAAADNVKVTGPDVRRVDVRAGAANVVLKGRVRGSTRLAVQFALPWPARKGKTSLSGLAIAGGSLRGGTLVATTDTGGVVLDEDSPGLGELALWQVPRAVSALTSAPPMLAWSMLRDGWSANVDLVALSEMPMRDTLIDEADYTVLLRPGGETMQKLDFRVRNRYRQFLGLRLPDKDDVILSARVSGEPVKLSRGADGRLRIPLQQSVETLGGALSFPVEVIYLSRLPRLDERGRLKVPLARADIPIAQAHCTLLLPEGLETRRWKGAFRLAEKTATPVERMEYGRGHEAPEAAAAAANMTALADNYYRIALRDYNEGQIDDSEEAARQFLRLFPDDPRNADVNKLLADLYLLRAEDRRGKTQDEGGVPLISKVPVLRSISGRAARAQKSQLEQVFSGQNRDVLAQQDAILRQGWQKVRTGDEASAADAFRAAEALGVKLRVNEKFAAEQDALLAEARDWLAKQEALQEENRKLQERLTALRTAPAPPGEESDEEERECLHRGRAPRRPSAVVADGPDLPRDRLHFADVGGLAPGADKPVPEQPPVSNVAAGQQLAFQRATGKGTPRDRPVPDTQHGTPATVLFFDQAVVWDARKDPQFAREQAAAANTQLKAELERAEKGQAAPLTPPPAAAQPAGQTVEDVGKAVKRLVEQKRFVEAQGLVAEARREAAQKDAVQPQRQADLAENFITLPRTTTWNVESGIATAERYAQQARASLEAGEDPRRVRELALEALRLDARNREAVDVRDAAELLLERPSIGKEAETARLAEQTRQRRRSTVLSLTENMNSARALEASGRYGEALDAWKQAGAKADLLSVHSDMSTEQDEIAHATKKLQESTLTIEPPAELQHRRSTAALFYDGHAAVLGTRPDTNLGNYRWHDYDGKAATNRGSHSPGPPWDREPGGGQRPDAAVSEEDRAVLDKMEDNVELAFDDIPLSEVINFLRTVTDINFVHNRTNMTEDPRLTLNVTTSLENGLNQITRLTGTSWAIKDGRVVIGLASEIHDIEMRIHNVRNLLVDYGDATGDDDRDDDSGERAQVFILQTERTHEEDRAVLDKMKDEVELAFDDIPLSEVINFLKTVTEINFVYNRTSMTEDPRLTLNVTTSLENGLNQITRLTGTSWRIDDGLIHVGLASEIQPLAMRIYNVRDLLTRDPAFARHNKSMQERASQLISLIAMSCAPDTWAFVPTLDLSGDDDDALGGGFGDQDKQAKGTGTAAVRRNDPGQIVIMQTEETHRCIERLLQQLREENLPRLPDAQRRLLEVAGRDLSDVEKLKRLEEAVAEKWARAGDNTFSVTDLATNTGEGRRLEEFFYRNYTDVVIDRDEDGNAAGKDAVQYSNGQIITHGQFNTERVTEALENLRGNFYQKVTVNTRELALDEDLVRAGSMDWNDMEGGRWAVVDEATLSALLTLEQRAGQFGQAVHKGQFEVVPGTGQRLPNDARLRLDLASDDANGLIVNGSTVELPHEKVLLVEANGRTVALRAGATQFWQDAPKAPEIKEVPLEIDVPEVGKPVRFERVLLNPEDESVIECDYVFREEMRHAH